MVSEFRPYLEGSGISTVKYARAISPLMRAIGTESTHIPMMGFRVSHESLYKGFSESDSRLPRIARLPRILEVARPGVLTTLHYTSEKDYSIAYDIYILLKVGEIYSRGLVGGIQFGNVWPGVEQVAKVREWYQDLALILTLGPAAVDGMSKEQISKKVSKEYGFVNYIMINSSVNAGTGLNIEYSTDLYNALKSTGIASTIGFTDGFSGGNVREKLTKIKGAVGTNYFCVSTDLNERIVHEKGKELLDLDGVKGYLRNSSETLAQ